MILQPMTAVAGSEALERLRRDVQEFVTWSEDGLRELDALRMD